MECIRRLFSGLCSIFYRVLIWQWCLLWRCLKKGLGFGLYILIRPLVDITRLLDLGLDEKLSFAKNDFSKVVQSPEIEGLIIKICKLVDDLEFAAGRLNEENINNE